MKSFRLKSVLVVLFLAAAFVSCDNDNDDKTDNPIIKPAFVTEIKGPATGKVSDELSYEITFAVDNGCGEFSKISDVTIGAVKGLQVEAAYSSGPCTQAIEYKKTVYKFKSAVKGTFEIKFKKSETEFLTQKVVID
ncbi:hypothetical protein [Flavobacterium reichenbachii]|uniref:Lipoprotein n=1 Tax=Flavobacterium reichenbachii TaxID=362418 RepID=A0A085ZIX9_9FLAO|nr:hypothetical protein [Flavobacterium reichenbachii]KFF04393.1 hypothetical protein IW19_02110 [Flavobacterium reichenbachii]OXB12540.1 hypothetical protein B0A68_17255 [Flavobacterium reichenbachii]